MGYSGFHAKFCVDDALLLQNDHILFVKHCKFAYKAILNSVWPRRKTLLDKYKQANSLRDMFDKVRKHFLLGPKNVS